MRLLFWSTSANCQRTLAALPWLGWSTFSRWIARVCWIWQKLEFKLDLRKLWSVNWIFKQFRKLCWFSCLMTLRKMTDLQVFYYFTDWFWPATWRWIRLSLVLCLIQFSKFENYSTSFIYCSQITVSVYNKHCWTKWILVSSYKKWNLFVSLQKCVWKWKSTSNFSYWTSQFRNLIISLKNKKQNLPRLASDAQN